MINNYLENFPDNRCEGETILRQSQLVMLRILKIVDYICRENNIQYWLDSGTLLGAVRHKGFIPWDDDIDIVMPREDYERFAKIAPELIPKDLFFQNNETDEYYDMTWAKVRDRNSKIIEYKPGKYHQGMFIDIFPMDDFSGDYEEFLKIKRRYKFYLRLISLIKEPLEKSMDKKILFRNLLKTFLKLVCFPISLRSRKSALAMVDGTNKSASEKYFNKNGKYLVYGMDNVFSDFIALKSTIYPLKEMEFEGAKFYVPNDCDKYLRDIFGDYMKLPKEEDRVPHNLGLKPILTEEEKVELNMNSEVKSI